MHHFTAVALFGTLCVSITVLVPPASSAAYGDCTTTSDACPDKSECVQGSCIACEFDPRKCMRSVEKCHDKCTSKNSKNGCYIHDEVNEAAGTVTSSLVCAPKDPCDDITCDDGYCVNADAGDRPPVAQCRPDDDSTVEPCDGKKCSDGYRCAVRRGLCGDYSCIVDTVCIGEHDCDDCEISYQFCEITQENGVGKGKCSNFTNRWDDA